MAPLLKRDVFGASVVFDVKLAENFGADFCGEFEIAAELFAFVGEALFYDGEKVTFGDAGALKKIFGDRVDE